MTQTLPYSPGFYDAQRAGSLSSAEIVLPVVFDLLPASSVLDIGCGVGTWLAAAHKLGATRLIGYDGPQRAGHRIVKCLCDSADVVLFGAAIPGQGGKHHVNEQWQSYWIRLFAANGFDAYDVVRPACWNDKRVETWYAQNTLLYLKRGGRLALSASDCVVIPDMVHPQLWANPSPRTILKHLPRVVRRIVRF
jgi:SAM-dependent methyltransferase